MLAGKYVHDVVVREEALLPLGSEMLVDGGFGATTLQDRNDTSG